MLTFWKIWSNVGAEAVDNVTGDTLMNDFEEESVIALKNLFDKVKTLRHITIQEMLIPETYQLYEENLQAAYDALTTVEDVLASVGMKLEYEHWRLGGAVEELTPMILHIPSASEKVMELVEEKLQGTDWPMERAEPLSE
jgi:hypothetical protein